jgi:phosphonate transport system substrate-binding protein
MDCQMPEMDGFAATAVIRDPGSKVLNHKVPVIAMTANAMRGDQERCMAAGMDDYLTKPVKKAELMKIIEKWLCMRGSAGGEVPYCGDGYPSQENKRMIKTLRMTSLVSLVMLSAGMAAAGDTFVIGVAPHTSARVILEMYQPLRIYMEKTLGVPVEVATAPDFDTFARRGLAQELDLAVTTGQQARLLQTDAKYFPLLTYKADFKSVILVAAGSVIRTPVDLQGKLVLGLSQTSQVTLWGERWLKEKDIAVESVKYVSASDSVAQLVITGEADAGFVSLANYQKLAPEVRDQLRILAESKPMAGRVYLLNGRHAALRKKIDAALWKFSATPEAKKYFEANKLEGYRKLRPNELKEMDPYAKEVRKFLNSGAK